MPDLNTSTLFIIIAFVVFIIFEVSSSLISKKKLETLADLLVNKDFKAFFEKVNDIKFVRSLPAYNVHLLKLNAYVMTNDKANIDKEFSTITNMRISEEQKENIVFKAFDYYSSNQNGGQAKVYLDKLKELKNTELAQQAQMLYDINILKKADYIDEMEPLFEKTKNVHVALMLAIQYENIGNQQKADYYKSFVKEAQKQFTK